MHLKTSSGGKQRPFYELRGLSYKERLRRLNALSLTNRRLYAAMTFIYNCLHGHINFPAVDMGLRLKSTITTANGLELEQICPSNNKFANLFRCRAVSQWISCQLILCLLNLLMFLNVYCTIIYLIYSIVTQINFIDFLSACLIFYFFSCVCMWGVLSSARKSFYTLFFS